jgi:pantoate--beta-alanine ligase
METLRAIADLRRQVAKWKSDLLTVGVVPTMGALHEGHLSLIDRAKADCDRVVATLFVNPLQFGPNEDYETYPRDELGDSAKLDARGCHVLFAPSVDEMFPDADSPPGAFLTAVSVSNLSAGLCGPVRPGHFAGMATQVMKLLLISQAHRAYFGEKDYQQLHIIRRMVRDLNVPTAVLSGPTVREDDGLALSSRNVYLTKEQRRIAPSLFRILRNLADSMSRGAVHSATATEAAADALRQTGFDSVDYVAVVDAETLTPLEEMTRPARALAAARLGRTRLIDNVAIVPQPTSVPRAAFVSTSLVGAPAG